MVYSKVHGMNSTGNGRGVPASAEVPQPQIIPGSRAASERPITSAKAKRG